MFRFLLFVGFSFLSMAVGIHAEVHLTNICYLEEPTSCDSLKTNHIDSITNLKEFVIVGKRAWFEGEKAIFVPRKNEKNLATDAVSLIQRMSVPLLYVQDNNIYSRVGGAVNIFINGVAADNMDLSTFWPRNVVRVEYIMTSSDPRFQGKSNIVNFVMKEYVVGGVSKIEGFQTFPNEGRYGVSSKLVYKDMTFNAMFNGSYTRDHLSKSEEKSVYEDVWYDNIFYDEIGALASIPKDVLRNDKVYFGFNARYRKNFTTISHSFRLDWNRNPESYERGMVNYEPKLFDRTITAQTLRSHSLSPSLTGDYTFQLSPKWYLSTSWNFNHSHTYNSYSYAEGGLSEILNVTNENAYTYGAVVSLTYWPSSKFYFTVVAQENRKLYDTEYSGYGLSKQWQQRGFTALGISCMYRPYNYLYFVLFPKLTINDWNINHQYKKTQVMEGISLNSYYTINSSNNLALVSFYTPSTPNAVSSNDLMLRQTELTWIKGNPLLKSSESTHVGLVYTWLPLNYLDMSLNVSYTYNKNDVYTRYIAGGLEYDGVIIKYENAKKNDKFSLQYNLNVRLFNNKMALHGDVTCDKNIFHGMTNKQLTYIRPRVDASGYFGNCGVSILYYGREKYFANGGYQTIKTDDQYELGFTYGNGNLNLNVNISNPFKKYRKRYVISDFDVYKSNLINWGKGRSVSVSVVYTFDYGKKVSRGIEISQEDIYDSSIMKR